VSHMVPLHFPVLIILPALVLDLTFPLIRSMGKWMQAAIQGTVFLVVILAVSWPLGTFLVYSPAARTWLFGTQEFAFFLNPSLPSIRNVFHAWESTRTQFLSIFGLAFVSGILGTRIGIAWSGFLTRLRR
jgi:hypothetical protein